MSEPTEQDDRYHRLQATFRAARNYTKDPSEDDARKVELAWSRVRRFDALVRWRLVNRDTRQT